MSHFFTQKSSFDSSSSQETFQCGQFLGKRFVLQSSWQRAIFLFGELGSGKTTFIKGLAAGIDLNLNIKSPTFQRLIEIPFFLNQENWTLAHFDIYRKADQNLWQILQEKIKDQKTLTIIEWSQNLPCNFSFPQKRIEIYFDHQNNINKRKILVKFFDPEVPTKKQAFDIIEEFKTPLHVIAHQKGVLKVAYFLGQKILKQGFLLDLNLVNIASFLHDFVRIINFPNLDFSKFKEKITFSKKAIWEKVRNDFKNQHHALAAADILQQRNFSSCAQVVAAHRSKRTLENKEMTLEEKIVYLADKKILHDRLVSLSERFRDGAIRHPLKNESLRKKLRNNTLSIAKELFSLAGIKNEEEADNFLKKNWNNKYFNF